MCKCGRANCTGYYLLHPKEMSKVSKLKEKELSLNNRCTFDLRVSPSSGEIFTTFYELHVLA